MDYPGFKITSKIIKGTYVERKLKYRKTKHIGIKLYPINQSIFFKISLVDYKGNFAKSVKLRLIIKKSTLIHISLKKFRISYGNFIKTVELTKVFEFVSHP